MRRRLMRRGVAGALSSRAFVAGALVVVLALAGGLVYRRVHVTGTTGKAAVHAPRPTLYCDFYNFMHNATVVSFDFDVADAGGADPKYSERFVVENEGQKTEFGGADQSPAPQWSFAREDETPTIASPDGATRIVLYGLKPKVDGVFWVEAGVRSNSYRNLEGKCRQAHFAAASQATDAGRKP